MCARCWLFEGCFFVRTVQYTYCVGDALAKKVGHSHNEGYYYSSGERTHREITLVPGQSAPVKKERLRIPLMYLAERSTKTDADHRESALVQGVSAAPALCRDLKCGGGLVDAALLM